MEFCLGSSKSSNKNKLIENDYEIDDFELDYFPSYPLEKQLAIETSKMVGNELFNCGNFKKAISEYTKGIGNFNTSKQQEQAADDNSGPLMLLSTLLSNRALAYIKLGEYEQALYDSRAVIAYRSDWEKGFFLRGEAYFGLRLFEKAVSSFAMALKLVMRFT
jgi:tetratricopeptide (TPR) repeat protein